MNSRLRAAQGTKAMREMQCPCGITLTGADDAELVRLGREHADQHHPDDNITDDFISEHVRTNAHDAVAGASTSPGQ